MCFAGNTDLGLSSYEYGELAPVDDVEVLAAATERMNSNPQLRRTYAENAQRYFFERFPYAGFVKTCARFSKKRRSRIALALP